MNHLPLTCQVNGDQYGGAGAALTAPGGDGIVDRSARSLPGASRKSATRAGMEVISLGIRDLIPQSIRYWAAKSRYAFSIRTGVARSGRPSSPTQWRSTPSCAADVCDWIVWKRCGAPLTLWQAATADTLPDDSAASACRWPDEWTAAGPWCGAYAIRRCNLTQHQFDPTATQQREPIIFTESVCMRTREHPDSASPGMAKAKSTPQHCAPSLACALSGRP